ncbi:hypothetical protein MRX96_057752 [Rhipicephalus microplus]
MSLYRFHNLYQGTYQEESCQRQQLKKTSDSHLSAKVPEKERLKGRRKANTDDTALDVLDAAVAHTPTGHTLRASVCVDREAIPGPPDLTVMPSAVVCEPLVGVSGEEICAPRVQGRRKDGTDRQPEAEGIEGIEGFLFEGP